MDKTLCSIEITSDNGLLKAKVRGKNGYEEYENEDMEYLLQMVYDEIDNEEDYCPKCGKPMGFAGEECK